jgi:hypothetical protein
LKSRDSGFIITSNNKTSQRSARSEAQEAKRKKRSARSEAQGSKAQGSAKAVVKGKRAFAAFFLNFNNNKNKKGFRFCI